MAIIIKMPKLSDTMTEGTIANWTKKKGERVEEGDLLLEVETDKATMDYHSPEEGHLLQILAPEGSVQVGEPIAVLGDKTEKFDLSALLGKPTKTRKPSETTRKPSETTRKPSETTRKPSETTQDSVKQSVAPDKRLHSSPLARKIAQEQGIALASVVGTGPRGRIVARDIQPSTTDKSPKQVAQKQIFKISTMRSAIAKRLVEAKNNAPHFYLRRSANVENLLRARHKFNKRAADADKVSFNDILSFFCIKTLAKHPEINSSWADGKAIVHYHNVNLATAVALENGLVTPVVRNSERLTLQELSVAIKQLVTKVRSGKLQPEDYADGTFTISNLGMYGIEEFTAIINPPQAAILAVGAVNDTVRAVNKQAVIQQRMYLTLSCDHRVIDGATGAKFLATLVEDIEFPFFI